MIEALNEDEISENYVLYVKDNVDKDKKEELPYEDYIKESKLDKDIFPVELNLTRHSVTRHRDFFFKIPDFQQLYFFLQDYLGCNIVSIELYRSFLNY